MIPPTVYKEEGSRDLSSRVDLDILNNEVCPMVAEIAQSMDVPTIDLHTFTDGHPEWFADGLHPNDEGKKAFAQFIYDSIFG